MRHEVYPLPYRLLNCPVSDRDDCHSYLCRLGIHPANEAKSKIGAGLRKYHSHVSGTGFDDALCESIAPVSRAGLRILNADLSFRLPSGLMYSRFHSTYLIASHCELRDAKVVGRVIN